jgi:hypothetical protein
LIISLSAAALPKLRAVCHLFLDDGSRAFHANAIASALFRPVESHVRAGSTAFASEVDTGSREENAIVSKI